MKHLLVVLTLTLLSSQLAHAEYTWCKIPAANSDAGVTRVVYDSNVLPATLTVTQNQRDDVLTCVDDNVWPQGIGHVSCSRTDGKQATLSYNLTGHGGIATCFFDSEPF